MRWAWLWGIHFIWSTFSKSQSSLFCVCMCMCAGRVVNMSVCVVMHACTGNVSVCLLWRSLSVWPTLLISKCASSIKHLFPLYSCFCCPYITNHTFLQPCSSFRTGFGKPPVREQVAGSKGVGGDGLAS